MQTLCVNAFLGILVVRLDLDVDQNVPLVLIVPEIRHAATINVWIRVPAFVDTGQYVIQLIIVPCAHARCTQAVIHLMNVNPKRIHQSIYAILRHAHKMVIVGFQMELLCARTLSV